MSEPTQPLPPAFVACPSRIIHFYARILHCSGEHHRYGPLRDVLKHNANKSVSWSDAGAMPADEPCDRRCAQCVERTRDAMLDAAIAWFDTGGNQPRQRREAVETLLVNAIYECRKVMGR